jgi:hypothetical protein
MTPQFHINVECNDSRALETFCVRLVSGTSEGLKISTNKLSSSAIVTTNNEEDVRKLLDILNPQPNNLRQALFDAAANLVSAINSVSFSRKVYGKAYENDPDVVYYEAKLTQLVYDRLENARVDAIYALNGTSRAEVERKEIEEELRKIDARRTELMLKLEGK